MIFGILILLANTFISAVVGRVYPVLQVVSEGSNITIKCITRTEAVWIKNGVFLEIITQDPNTIELYDVKESDSGSYVCIGESKEPFTAKSDLVVAKERSTKVIKKAEFGDGLHLYCKSHGLVQWYFQKFKSNREAITLSSSPHIYIYPVQQYSAGTYYCYGQNSRFQTFLASFELLVYDPKQINPRFQEVEENSDAVIQCKSSSPVNWTFEGRPIPSNAEKFNSTTLYISRVNYANQGYYECEGTYFGQLSMITRAKLMIQAKSQTLIPAKQTAKPGQLVRFICSLPGVVFWSFNDKDLPPNAIEVRKIRSNETVLLLRNVGWHNEGTYACYHANNNGRHLVKLKGNLSIEGFLKKEVTPVQQDSELGDTVEFTCKSEGDVVWLHNGGSLPSNSEMGYDPVSNVNWLRLINVNKENEGQYVCQGSDEGKFISHGLLRIEDECPLPSLLHGQVEVPGGYVGAISKYECAENYLLMGMPTRVCLKDGQWSGDDPICKRAVQSKDNRVKAKQYWLFITSIIIHTLFLN